MPPADAFSRYHAELLEGHYDCVDRLVLNAFFPLGQTGGGLRSWWRRLHGDDATLDDAHLRDMAGAFSRRVKVFCTKNAIPLVEARAGQRKHQLAEPYLPVDPKFRGLFLIITGNAAAPVWEVLRNAQGQITQVRHRKSWPYVKHYHFHIIDAEWGHIIIRMCGYPPFGVQIILNGHEWVERAARRSRIKTAKSSNCFVEGSDFSAVNRLARRLTRPDAIGRLAEVCNRWIYATALIFALSSEDQRRSGFTYQYSVFQMELSRNLLFRRGTTMDEVFQKLIDRTRVPLDLKSVKTIFGGRHRHHNRTRTGRRPPEITKSVQTYGYNLTVFKLKWGNLTLKIYDKGERVLRIEVVVHNAKDLRCGRMLEKLPVLLERMNGMLARFLDAVQAAHVSFLDDGTFETWHEPTLRGTRRLAGIDVNKARNRYVLDAVVALSTRPDGFTLSHLADAVRARNGWSATRYSTRHAAYDLARLRGKSLVHPVEHSRRYRASPAGVRAMCAYLVLRDQVIKPLLAGVVQPLGRPPKTISFLDRHYMALRNEMHRTFETIGLAA